MATKHYRAHPQSDCRAITDDPEGPVIEGHAIVYNQLSEDIGGYREIIAKGAFTESIERSLTPEGVVKALWNHNSDIVLGSTDRKTLELKEDDIGVFVRIRPATNSQTVGPIDSIARGDVSKMSFAFSADPSKVMWEKVGRENHRTVGKGKLYDVSPVAFPAYPQTDVGLRSLLADSDEDSQRVLQALQRSRHGLELDDEDIDILQQLTARLYSTIQDGAVQETVTASTFEDREVELETTFAQSDDIVVTFARSDDIIRRLGILERRVKLLEG